jgi:hypothetical protein
MPLPLSAAGVSTTRAHHGEPDTRVAAGRFDDRLSRPESSRALGVLDYAER